LGCIFPRTLEIPESEPPQCQRVEVSQTRIARKPVSQRNPDVTLPEYLFGGKVGQNMTIVLKDEAESRQDRTKVADMLKYLIAQNHIEISYRIRQGPLFLNGLNVAGLSQDLELR